MPDITQRTADRRHRTVVCAAAALIALALCCLPVVLGALGNGIAIRAPAGLTLLVSILTVTLLVIYDCIACYDRACVTKGDGS